MGSGIIALALVILICAGFVWFGFYTTKTAKDMPLGMQIVMILMIVGVIVALNI